MVTSQVREKKEERQARTTTDEGVALGSLATEEEDGGQERVRRLRPGSRPRRPKMRSTINDEITGPNRVVVGELAER